MDTLTGAAGFGEGGLGAVRTNIGSGKGKGPRSVEDDDRRLGNVDIMGDESPLDNTNPSQRGHMYAVNNIGKDEPITDCRRR